MTETSEFKKLTEQGQGRLREEMFAAIGVEVERPAEAKAA